MTFPPSMLVHLCFHSRCDRAVAATSMTSCFTASCPPRLAAHTAARTSVLFCRWRPVWTNLPKEEFLDLENVVPPCWANICNTLIRGAAHSNAPRDAVALYARMARNGGVRPDKLTYPFVLRACAAMGSGATGEQVHVHVVSAGCECDAFVKNACT
jgi:pentatricopeptide repeat protein